MPTGAQIIGPFSVGGKPHRGGERGGVGEDRRRGAAVRDPHRGASGGRLLAVVEPHARGSAYPLVARDGECR